MRKQFMTTDDDWVIIISAHVILLILWFIGTAMA